ncbi:MAG: GIY-YIG nuclease family protein [bacterium]
MYVVYALYNAESNRIYIGQTEDLEERLRLHAEKQFKQSFTAKNKGEWQLIYQEEIATRPLALKREKQLKSFRGREFVRKHIPKN